MIRSSITSRTWSGADEAVIREVVSKHEFDVGAAVHAVDPPTAVVRASASRAARMARCA